MSRVSSAFAGWLTGFFGDCGVGPVGWRFCFSASSRRSSSCRTRSKTLSWSGSLDAFSASSRQSVVGVGWEVACHRRSCLSLRLDLGSSQSVSLERLPGLFGWRRQVSSFHPPCFFRSSSVLLRSALMWSRISRWSSSATASDSFASLAARSLAVIAAIWCCGSCIINCPKWNEQ
jgi:hypothetical protein